MPLRLLRWGDAQEEEQPGRGAAGPRSRDRCPQVYNGYTPRSGQSKGRKFAPIPKDRGLIHSTFYPDMEPKRKTEKRPPILATVLTDKQWKEGTARPAKTIKGA